jgi:hypothetical protein
MAWTDIDFDRREWPIPDTENGSPVIAQLADVAVTSLQQRRNNDSPWVFLGSGKSGHMMSPKRGEGDYGPRRYRRRQDFTASGGPLGVGKRLLALLLPSLVSPLVTSQS